MRAHGLLLGMGLVLLGALGAPRPVEASGTLFDKMKSVLEVVVDPDTIEVARYAIKRPADAATLFARAAAQDYPLFALIGAAKAAKNRNMPGVGVFDYPRCMAPIAAVDAVFAHASDTIDDAQGKAATNAAMGTASAIAAEYAKAQTQQARQAAMEQLAQSVPYFGDLPLICGFVFETNLQGERNIQQMVNQTAQDVRTAYEAFSDGDIATGTSVLFTLGVGKEAVCSLVDSAVLGGLIGRTPGLGELAKGACAGFVGAVIDGVKGLVKGGVGAVEAGVDAVAKGTQAVACAVYSLFGDGCSSAEPPPTGLGNATAWCAGRGGLESYLSKTNAVDDYNMRCNDGSTCRIRPGGPLQCATAQEIAARRAQLVAQAEADFQSKLPAWEAEFDARWHPQCQDADCKAGLGIVRLNAVLLARQAHDKDPEAQYAMATYFIFEAADRTAVSVIDDGRYRLWPAKWAQGFRARWNEDCQDEVCRNGIAFVAASAQVQVQAKAKATPRPPYATTATVYAEADRQAAVLVAEDAQRAVEFNRKTTADAGVAWEMLTNAIWGRQCADAPCLAEVKKLSAQMRVAANLVQMGDPSLSSLAVQGKVGPEYGVKFKAAIEASKARAAAARPPVTVLAARPPASVAALMQKPRFKRPPSLLPAVGRRIAPAAPAASRGMPALTLVRPTAAAAPALSLERGTDRMGGDYRGFALREPDPQQCREACAADARCLAYTYVNPGVQRAEAMCYLKNVVPAPRRDGCCTSGARQP